MKAASSIADIKDKAQPKYEFTLKQRRFVFIVAIAAGLSAAAIVGTKPDLGTMHGVLDAILAIGMLIIMVTTLKMLVRPDKRSTN